MKNMPANKGNARVIALDCGGFTLIELLVVIAVIGVLSGLLLGVAGSVSRNRVISNAKSELAAIDLAIQSYHSAYGVYPPSASGNLLVNPLYFELVGTTNVIAGGITNCTTLDGQQSVPLSKVYSIFGVQGFVNCTRGSGDDLVAAKTFLTDLKASQIGTNATTSTAILVTSVGGPDATYKPLNIPGMNPWRYNSANPTNNPGTYDLYVQLVINGKTNLVCNWSKSVQINTSYP